MNKQRLCKGGHPYAPMRSRRGWLRCRMCHNARGRSLNARRRLEKLARYGTSDRRTLRRKQTGVLKCERCGEMFHRRVSERPYAFARRRFCSWRCFKLTPQPPRPRTALVIQHPCRQCGKLTDNKASFCSRACWALRPVKPKRNCAVCGQPCKSSSANTCSRDCQKLRTRKQRACQHCGMVFWVHNSSLRRGGGTFCGLSCYSAVRGQRPSFMEAVCDQCGKPFRRTRAALMRNKKAVFCSPLCFREYFQGPRHSAYRPGEGRHGVYIAGWQKLSEQVRERDSHCCQRCGKPEMENGVKLSVDHIIPWRVFEENEKNLANDPKNLVSLCRNCHGWKTSRAESRWLRGDVVDFKQYERAIALPTASR